MALTMGLIAVMPNDSLVFYYPTMGKSYTCLEEDEDTLRRQYGNEINFIPVSIEEVMVQVSLGLYTDDLVWFINLAATKAKSFLIVESPTC